MFKNWYDFPLALAIASLIFTGILFFGLKEQNTKKEEAIYLKGYRDALIYLDHNVSVYNTNFGSNSYPVVFPAVLQEHEAKMNALNFDWSVFE